MLGKIIKIIGDSVRIQLTTNLYELDNLMGKNVIFEESDYKIVGEILEGDTTYLDINEASKVLEAREKYNLPDYTL